MKAPCRGTVRLADGADASVVVGGVVLGSKDCVVVLELPHAAPLATTVAPTRAIRALRVIMAYSRFDG